MSYATIGASSGPTRLLPDQIEERLRAAFNRLAGAALIVLALGAWASLLTWSIDDPTFARGTGARPGNLLGTPGATLSDILLHGLGLAAVFTVLPFVFWGASLLLRQRVARWRFKVLLWGVAVLCLAGALAAVPLVQAWPLRHGFGGLIGDFIYALCASLLAGVNAAHGATAAGLFLFAGGASALFAALGAGRDELAMLWHGDRWHGPASSPRYSPQPARSTGWSGQAHGQASGGAQAEPGLPWPASPGGGVLAQVADLWRLRPGAGGNGRSGSTRAQYTSHGPAPQQAHEGARPRGLTADSRDMAERFAPPSARQASAGGTEKSAGRGLFHGFRGRPEEPAYRRPSLNMLKRAPAHKPGPEFAQNVQRGVAKLLEDVLMDFGIKGQIQSVKPGPVITLYELEPARGVKSSRIIGLSDDIARSMSATSARMAGVPGRNLIGIELPNMRRETVYLRELLETEAYKAAGGTLPLVLGKSIGGEPVVADLARMPHVLVAGTTGSGKSVGINAMILSLLYRLGPEHCRFLMIDPKMLELSVYNGIPHLLAPVITDPHKAVAALNWVVREMEERYKRMAQLSVRNIDVFNNRVRNAARQGEPLNRTIQTGYNQCGGQPLYETQRLQLEAMPYIVVVVDEMADLMLTAGKDIEGAVQRLAQMARAAGIHLIMATQRPSVDVITGTIKANFPTRISFKVASKIDSRTILGEQGAEQLLGAGDMLLSTGTGQIVRVHGPFVADEEVEQVASYLRSLGEPAYVAGLGEEAGEDVGQTPAAPAGEDGDDLYDKAVAVVVRDRKASTSYIQRRLSIGYNRAADIMERMEQEGLVSPANSVGKRSILAGQAPSGRPDG